MSVDDIDFATIEGAECLRRARGIRDKLAAALLDYLQGDDGEYSKLIEEVCRREKAYWLLELEFKGERHWLSVINLFEAACRRVELLERNEYHRRFAAPEMCACA